MVFIMPYVSSLHMKMMINMSCHLIIIIRMIHAAADLSAHIGFYRATHVVLARYCNRMSSVRLSVCLSVCDVDVSWAYRLDYFEINFPSFQLGTVTLAGWRRVSVRAINRSASGFPNALVFCCVHAYTGMCLLENVGWLRACAKARGRHFEHLL